MTISNFGLEELVPSFTNDALLEPEANWRDRPAMRLGTAGVLSRRGGAPGVEGAPTVVLMAEGQVRAKHLDVPPPIPWATMCQAESIKCCWGHATQEFSEARSLPRSVSSRDGKVGHLVPRTSEGRRTR